MGCDQSLRLMIAPELHGFGCRQGLAVDENPVRWLYGHGRGVEPLAVDANATLGNPALRIAPRAQACACESLGDPDRFVRCWRRTRDRSGTAALRCRSGRPC